MIRNASIDCNHSESGVCSRCFLQRAYALTASQSVDTIVDSHPPTPLTVTLYDSDAKRPSPLQEFNYLPVSQLGVAPLRSQSQPVMNETSVELAEDEMTRFSINTCETIPTLKEKQSMNDLQQLSYTSFADIRRNSHCDQTEEADINKVTDRMSPEGSLSGSGWLMRLFESPLFDASICMQYLHKAKAQKHVLNYLGEKLFSFDPSTLDFYLPQLINLYINLPDVAESIQPYIKTRCKESGQVALLCCWLLEAYGGEALKYEDKRHGERLRQWILQELHGAELESEKAKNESASHGRSFSTAVLSPDGLASMAMRRSESAFGSLRYLTSGSLSTGHAFDTGCTCFDDSPDKEYCECETLRMRGEKEFMTALTKIGDYLKELPTKEEKSRRLVSELLALNANLPARVWLPLYSDHHIVLRIPPTSGCVLNSKDKAPYCIYVEILRCESVQRVRVPARLCDSEAELYQKLPNQSLDSQQATPPDRASAQSIRSELDEKILSGEMASDTMSQKSMDSWTSDERIVSAADISRRLTQWVKKPRKQMRLTKEDPSAFAMSEPWEEKRERLRVASPYGRMPGWDLLPLIVKTGDDLRQELLAYQLLSTLKRIWEEENVALWLRPYKILVISHCSGMIEPIVNACSLHQIKRNQTAIFAEEHRTVAPSLLAHFVDSFGEPNTEPFLKAQQNFVASCAAYSLACYFLQVKDRHNGNILIDADGHLIHIDFGFILSSSPKNLGFETSPFKLTTELVDVMGGVDSELFADFKSLMMTGLKAAQKHHDRIMNIAEIMIHGSPLACFRGGEATLRAMRSRFHMGCTDAKLKALVDSMVEQSRDSITTRLYDNFQYYTNGIL